MSAFSKVWRNSGIGTPKTRFRSLWPATKARPGIPAMIMVILLISSQHATYGIDSGIPGNDRSANEVDQSIYDLAPDILRQDLLGLFSVMNSEQYDPSESGLWYLGTFGPSFGGQGWNEAYEWLSEQDSDVPFSERPAFVSWWDYGFQPLLPEITLPWQTTSSQESRTAGQCSYLQDRKTLYLCSSQHLPSVIGN